MRVYRAECRVCGASVTVRSGKALSGYSECPVCEWGELEWSEDPRAVTNYGEDLAGTLTSRADSSAGPMGGQNVVCMADTQPNTTIDSDTCGTLTARQYKDPPVVAHD